MTPTALAESRLPLKRINQGKVREIYQVDDHTLLLVASDRISAFDVVMAEPIPHKGTVLTQMSAYWFRTLSELVPNHYVTVDADEIVRRVPVLGEYRATITGRAMLVRRANPIPFECVVRGYLAGSGWAEYRERGTMAGEPLNPGLLESDRLDPPLFTPATKAVTGHDENITVGRLQEMLGPVLAQRLREASLALYRAAREHAARRGIIIADTKFEFGQDGSGRLLLIDELLTPDSSRFWPADRYHPGRSQPSFDKQPLRDYLSGLKRAGRWDGNPPPPALPHEIVQATSVRYQDAYLRITGEPLRLPS
ncbi:MAG: phosphoribosylaminoimidazolesuccinocarboxamide synthase [Gemmatimonadetes bacterium]|nr:phosphoribosylaminoimidazolesuccinocarboxamide synthase [Gemmatimonadota bacterium]